MTKGMIFIRTATQSDLSLILHLFSDTILNVNAADYTHEQLNAWSSAAANQDVWLTKLEQDYFIVALIDEEITGFASLTNEGAVDLLYVHKEYQRKGIAASLLRQLEQKANALGLNEITTDASITAYPFFIKHGFYVTEEYVKQRNGVDFLNRKMKKKLRLG